jgi:hypothetical protein
MFLTSVRYRCIPIMVAVVLGLCSVELRAQAKRPQAAVLLAISDSFPYRNAHAVVIRRPDETPTDVILVRRDKLRPSLLAEGIVLVEILRHKYGDAVRSQEVYLIPNPKRTNKHQNRAAQWSRSLMADRPKKMRGIGVASSIVVVP